MNANSFSATLKISLGLVGLTVSFLLGAYLLGFVPDDRRMEIEARARIAEALAVQLSSEATRSDLTPLKDTITAVAERNPSIRSLALRRASGEVLVTAGDHEQHWIDPGESRSTPTHVQVALNDRGKPWGRIEIAFVPLASTGEFLGIPTSILGLIGFLSLMGLLGYYMLLRRALRELDPRNVVPERVQAAFDTLGEGVLIVDERGVVMLANDAFARAVQKTPKALFGTRITDLHWRPWGESEQLGEFPWQIALRDSRNVTAARLGFRTSGGDFRNLLVNATCIRSENNQPSGVIVTFDDVTALERKNDDLILAVKRLQQSEAEISHQNRELQFLANHDPLTGCLNRRAFFEGFAAMLESAYRVGEPLACMMVDLDNFKKINDRYGHAVGDDVIAGMASVLKAHAEDGDLVGRYGGEEFCVALTGPSAAACGRLAESIRREVAARSVDWLNGAGRVTSSIGIAIRPEQPCSVKDFVNRADQALYEAKEAGRDRVVYWQGEGPPHAVDSPAGEPAERPLLKISEIAPAQAPLRQRDPEQEADEKFLSFMPGDKSSIEDPLTRLPSRIIFIDRVNQALTRADRNNKKVAVLHISFDIFNRLASMFGETASRELIGGVGARLAAVLRRSDTIALLDGSNRAPTLSRLADDKFVVEVSDLDETNTVTWIIKRLFDSLATPFNVAGQKLYLSADIGIALYPGDGRDVDTLLRHASIAEQHARDIDGTNNHRFFSAAMNENSRRQMMLETGIRQALADDEFTLFYQPIVDARNSRLRAVEALLRCEHADFQGMPIGMLIGVAEQTGLIIEIGEWVTRTAIGQAEAWMDAGLELPIVSVNLSAIQLADARAMETIMQIIMEMRLPVKKLQLEVTETALLRDIEAAGVALMRLQQLGVLIALDDFGTGQSSLGYLRRFRPDVLKIDRCFVGEITTSHADEALVSAIVALSQRMGLRVVAEGVESRQQWQKLQDIGCDEIQGFYIARPMPADAMRSWLRSGSGRAGGAPGGRHMAATG